MKGLLKWFTVGMLVLLGAELLVVCSEEPNVVGWGCGAIGAALLIWAVVIARKPAKALFGRRGILLEKLDEERASRSYPVKAVLVTASQAGKNRLVDGAAGQLLGGGLGAAVGFFGPAPKGKAIFYVTWSDQHTTTETVTIGSPDFHRWMALTENH